VVCKPREARTSHNACMSEQSPTAGSRKLERAIILQLLEDEHGRRSSSVQLASTLGAGTGALEQALRRLADAGVVCLDGGEVWASAAARRLDELGLLSI
jgi:DNA-binding GntR family transcriptional regulator